MDTPDDHSSLEPRLPDTDDLVFLCRHLNEAKAKYIVVGGFAIIQHGLARGTEDVDLLIDTSPENVEKVKAAMMKLPDGAVKDVNASDFEECLVVRVGDEFVVDLMRQGCGINYDEAAKSIEVMTVCGVPIPFASAKLLWRMKQTYRDKDVVDRHFLKAILKNELL